MPGNRNPGNLAATGVHVPRMPLHPTHYHQPFASASAGHSAHGACSRAPVGACVSVFSFSPSSFCAKSCSSSVSCSRRVRVITGHMVLLRLAGAMFHEAGGGCQDECVFFFDEHSHGVDLEEGQGICKGVLAVVRRQLHRRRISPDCMAMQSFIIPCRMWGICSTRQGEKALNDALRHRSPGLWAELNLATASHIHY